MFDAALLNKEDARLSYRGQGLAYMGLTEYDKAAEYLEKALSYSDFNVEQMDFDINYYLATAYYKLGELDKGQAYTIRLRRFAPRKKRRIT